jgi:hypothetical protein
MQLAGLRFGGRGAWGGVHGAAELGDRLGWDAKGGADGAHDFEGDAAGPGGLEQVDGAEGDARLARERTLAEQPAFADGRQGQCGLLGHVGKV